MYQNPSPQQLFIRLVAYFGVLISSVVVLAFVEPDALRWLPLGGSDAIEMVQSGDRGDLADFESLLNNSDAGTKTLMTAEQRGLVALFLGVSLMLTMLIMVPITWTYKATRHDTGYRKTFVRALIVLPVCATTIVLLIQDSLSLAFGLAALVAAVRFRVALQDPIDGIYIFAAICVGLAAGIGYLGVATVMAIFFCFANAVMWHLDYGRNPLDDAKDAKNRAKLEQS
jgi:hypothetical protein